MRLYEIISKERSQPITRVDIKKNFNRIETALSNPNRIYRGISNESNYLYVDPSQHVRKSANTTNYYTMLLDNSPEWSAYPKRSKSIICTTDWSTASDYSQPNEPFVVLPLDNPKIGVCPSDDLWDSFTNVIHSLDALNYALSHFYEYFCVKTEINDKLDQFDWNRLQSQLKQLETINWDDIPDGVFFKDMLGNFVVNSRFSINKMNNLLSPAFNDFQLTDLENFDVPVGQEVWFSGPAILISASVFEEFLNGL